MEMRISRFEMKAFLQRREKMKKTVTKRVLSMFLAVLMVVITFFITIPTVSAETQASIGDTYMLESWEQIGYGFNAITGNMSDPVLVVSNPILDFKKLKDNGFYGIGVKMTQTSGGYIKSEKISEITNSYSEEFAVDIGAKIPIYSVNLGVEGKFSTKFSESTTTIQTQLYQLYYANAVRNRYSLGGYDGDVSKLADNLSEAFSNKISQISSAVSSEKFDVATSLTKELYEYYGTHLVLSYYAGGRLEVTNHLVSSSVKTEKELENASSIGVSVGVGTFSVKSDISNTEKLGVSANDSTVNEAVTVKAYGGNYPELSTFTSSSYGSWLSSLEEKSTILGFVNDYSLVPVWELVNDNNVKEVLYSVFNSECLEVCGEYFTRYNDQASKISGYVYKTADIASGSKTINHYSYVNMDNVGSNYVAPGSTLYLNFQISSDYISESDITYEIAQGADYATVDEKKGILKISSNLSSMGNTIKVSVKVGGVELASATFEIKAEGADLFAGGYGTEERPFLLVTKLDLDRLANNPSYANNTSANNGYGYYFLMLNDINMDGGKFDCIPEFRGSFDGNGYSVYNFKIEGTGISQTSFFCIVYESAIIKNLQIGNPNFKSDALNGCSAYIDNTGVYYDFAVAGMVARNRGYIYNCVVNNVYIRGKTDWDGHTDDTFECRAGGLVGVNQGNIYNCLAMNNNIRVMVYTVKDWKPAQCGARVGGLVGLDSKIEDSAATKTISNSIVCSTQMLIDLYSVDDAGSEGRTYHSVGDLIGYCSKNINISNCITYNNIYDFDWSSENHTHHYGALLGYNECDLNVDNCYSAIIDKTNYVSGNNQYISGCVANLDMAGMNNYLLNNSHFVVTSGKWPVLNSVSDIGINTDNVQKIYEKGDEFNPLELVVYEKLLAGYDNKNATFNGFDISAESFNSLGTKAVTVKSYGGFTESFTVNVVCNHNSVEVVKGFEATCANTGLTDGLNCVDCSTVLVERTTIDKTDIHTFGNWEEHTAIQHFRCCSVCGEKEYADHVWNSGEVTTAPTHTASGVKTYTCTVCGETKTETIKPDTDNHTFGAWAEYSETQHIRECECGEKEYADHVWNSGEVTTAPTHTASGVKTYTCTVCGETKTETIEPDSDNHTFGEWKEHSETQHIRECACGEKEYANHVWNDGEVTTAPTHTTEGVKTYTCTVCGETKTEVIAPDADNHTFGEWKEHSETQHIRECACGEKEYADHVWNDGEQLIAGVITYTCEECGETKTKLVDIPDENTAKIVVNSVRARAGDTVDVLVSLENNPGFAALNLYFTYPEELTLVGAVNGVGTHGFTSDKTMFWDNTSDHTADGTLVTLTFEVADDAEDGDYTVSVVIVESYNENLDDVVYTPVSGTVEVYDFVYGDVTGDDVINGKDVIMIRKYIAAKDPITGESTVAVSDGADCNGDGVINGKDVILLRKYIAGKDPITGESSIVLGPVA